MTSSTVPPQYMCPWEVKNEINAYLVPVVSAGTSQPVVYEVEQLSNKAAMARIKVQGVVRWIVHRKVRGASPRGCRKWTFRTPNCASIRRQERSLIGGTLTTTTAMSAQTTSARRSSFSKQPNPTVRLVRSVCDANPPAQRRT